MRAIRARTSKLMTIPLLRLRLPEEVAHIAKLVVALLYDGLGRLTSEFLKGLLQGSAQRQCGALRIEMSSTGRFGNDPVDEPHFEEIGSGEAESSCGQWRLTRVAPDDGSA